MPNNKKSKAKAIDEYASNGKYTVKITCTEPGCKNVRMCKPQDAWQVKRCLPCQAKKKGAKLKSLIAKVKSPEHSMEKRHQERLLKLDAWVKRNDETVASVTRLLKQLAERAKTEPRPKRIWPK